VALAAYAADCNNYFPDNTDGAHASWCGTNVQNFWAAYLVRMVRTSNEKDKFHVLFCPTQKWHRFADTTYHPDFGPEFVIGYFYLPNRDPNFRMNAGRGYNYDVAGLQSWVARKRFGGEFCKAPTATDMKQAVGNMPGTPETMRWWEGAIPFSSHFKRTGEPFGGNFLFEDGRVNWFKTLQIGPGLTGEGWIFYYNIALN
jgi:hypothetical protein